MGVFTFFLKNGLKILIFFFLGISFRFDSDFANSFGHLDPAPRTL